MIISSTEPGPYGSIVEIADTRKRSKQSSRKNGNSSWGVKDNRSENSIRLAWRNNGRFDPISSAELPIYGLKLLVETAARHDMFSSSDLADIINELQKSQTKQKA